MGPDDHRTDTSSIQCIPRLRSFRRFPACIIQYRRTARKKDREGTGPGLWASRQKRKRTRLPRPLTIPRRHDIVKPYRKIDPRPNPLTGHPRLYMRQQRRRPRAASRRGCMDKGHLPRGARVKLPHRGNGNACRTAGVIRHNEGRQSFLPQSEWNHGFFPPLCLQGTGAFIFLAKNKSERMHTP